MITILFIPTILTPTALQTYHYNKIRFKHSVYPPNHLSPTIPIFLPLTLLLALHKLHSFSKPYYSIPFILLPLSSIILPTKLPLPPLILSLLLPTVLLFAKLFTNKP
ncbi:O-antigen ligase family protein, partial [Priestia megaterium]|uniref:O-antigen ligase family protein n=1 Tax=Priestia megaterium TaxID=1404 RepID=UPI002E26DF12